MPAINHFQAAASGIPGYRTPPTNYEKGACGKGVAYLHAPTSAKPSVLLITDSNGRNLVKPQVLVYSIVHTVSLYRLRFSEFC